MVEQCIKQKRKSNSDPEIADEGMFAALVNSAALPQTGKEL